MYQVRLPEDIKFFGLVVQVQGRCKLPVIRITFHPGGKIGLSFSYHPYSRSDSYISAKAPLGRFLKLDVDYPGHSCSIIFC